MSQTPPRRPRSAPPQPEPGPAPPPAAPLLAGLTGDRLVEAVVAAEILGPPVALRPAGTFLPRRAL